MKIEIRTNGTKGLSQIVVDGEVIYTNHDYDFSPYALISVLEKVKPEATIEHIRGWNFPDEK